MCTRVNTLDTVYTSGFYIYRGNLRVVYWCYHIFIYNHTAALSLAIHGHAMMVRWFSNMLIGRATADIFFILLLYILTGLLLFERI